MLNSFQPLLQDSIFQFLSCSHKLGITISVCHPLTCITIGMHLYNIGILSQIQHYDIRMTSTTHENIGISLRYRDNISRSRKMYECYITISEYHIITILWLSAGPIAIQVQSLFRCVVLARILGYHYVNAEIPSKWISFSTNRTPVDTYQDHRYHL